MITLDTPHKFRDPVHGFIYVSSLEKEIIDTQAFQRLRNIRQLALTYYVFHGAEHTRFGHSLGVMHLVSKSFRSAVEKGQFKFHDDPTENEYKQAWLEQILRLIALTHDLGHPPFSHGAEGVFPEKPPEKETSNKEKPKHYKHEDLTQAIILETDVGAIIHRIGAHYQAMYGKAYDITPEMICDIYKGANPGENSVFTFLKTFMDSELDCDKMDYLLRDSLFCGVSYGRFDVERLISSLTIYEKKDCNVPFLAIESGGIQAFEEFVLARYFMFVQVYFHRTRRYFDLLLLKALQETLHKGTFPVKVTEYLQWDDTRVIQLLKMRMQTSDNARRIIERDPFTCIYTTKTHPAGDGIDMFDAVQQRLKKTVTPEVFAAHFIVDRSADKLPHKLVPRKHQIDDEEAIVIVNKHSGKPSTISDESHIISNLVEKINIMRIYVDDIYLETAKSIIREYLPTKEENEQHDT